MSIADHSPEIRQIGELWQLVDASVLHGEYDEPETIQRGPSGMQQSRDHVCQFRRVVVRANDDVDDVSLSH